MRYSFTFFIMLFLIACNQADEKTEDTTIITLAPEMELTPLQRTVRDSLIQINTKDIELSGNKVKTVQVSGMEIIKISKKDYYSNEMKSQETDFNNYLQYMRKFEKTNSPINNPQQLEESKRKHNAVMVYLKKTIKTASSKPEWYKVVYYLKVDAGQLHYTQQQTTSLDSSFKKITADYSFLK